MLGAERTALNLLSRMSGVATATRALADAIAGSKAKIVCTRKTTPGLRTLEKEAVRLGGGANHRFGLDDAMLIKDNHIALAGGVRPALERAKRHAGHLVKIELEVDTLDQLAEALAVGVDAVLLDNMTPETMRRAVAHGRRPRNYRSLRADQSRNRPRRRRHRRRSDLLRLDHSQRADTRSWSRHRRLTLRLGQRVMWRDSRRRPRVRRR